MIASLGARAFDQASCPVYVIMGFPTTPPSTTTTPQGSSLINLKKAEKSRAGTWGGSIEWVVAEPMNVGGSG